MGPIPLNPHEANSMVKVQKRLAFKRKGRTYYKHMVTVPEAAFSALEWEDGQSLTHQVLLRESQLVLTPEKKLKSKKKRT